MKDLKKLVRTIPDFPKPGIMFRDITSLLLNPEGFQKVMDLFFQYYRKKDIDMIVGIEARGFIFGAPLALRLGVGFIPIRKPGKLPGKRKSIQYALEYGMDTLEMHEDAIEPGAKVLVMDDLLATGGTALAACHLIEQAGGVIAGCGFVIDLPELGGKKRLKGYDICTLIEFEGH